jgi:hypothetical protein
MAESIISNVLNKAIDGAYNFVDVLPWGTYATAGQTKTLLQDVTKAKIIRVWSGWDSADNRAGLHYDYFDNEVALGASRCVLFVAGSKVEWVLFRFPTATTFEVIASSNANLGIRSIKGVF